MILALCAGCAGPSMLGFPHANPLPATGSEVTVGLFGGAGVPNVGHGGLGLSYAAKVGDVGISVTGTAHYPGWGMVAYSGHLELALQPGEPPSRDLLLLGLGYWGWWGELHAPQASVGWLRAAPADDSGGFGGVRLNAGTWILERGDAPEVGFMAFVSAGGGYCWRIFLSQTSITFQIEPFLGTYARGEPIPVGGIHFALGFAWGT